LEKQDLIERFPSLLDRRTSEIRLSKSGYTSVRKWLVSYLD
jgi:DNA-binding MarR family transcriptional regulator